MKKMVLWLLVLLFGVLIQAVFLSGIFTVDSRPDLMLAVVVAAGLLGGKEMGLGIGFFAGLFQDLSSGNVFGLNVFSKMAVGYVSGLMESKVFKENFLLPPIAAVGATFLSGIVVFVFLSVLDYRTNFWGFIINQFFFAAIYNLVVAFPVHRVIYLLFFRQQA